MWGLSFVFLQGKGLHLLVLPYLLFLALAA